MFYYLATPYSNYLEGLEAAWIEACKQAAVLMRENIPVFSPIAHTHGIALHGLIGTGFAAWKEYDHHMLEVSAGLIVCMMHGWQESAGINGEIAESTRLGKIIHLMPPGRVPTTLKLAWQAWQGCKALEDAARLRTP